VVAAEQDKDESAASIPLLSVGGCVGGEHAAVSESAVATARDANARMRALRPGFEGKSEPTSNLNGVLLKRGYRPAWSAELAARSTRPM
jgi:hypothetical protein